MCLRPSPMLQPTACTCPSHGCQCAGTCSFQFSRVRKDPCQSCLLSLGQNQHVWKAQCLRVCTTQGCLRHRPCPRLVCCPPTCLQTQAAVLPSMGNGAEGGSGAAKQQGRHFPLTQAETLHAHNTHPSALRALRQEHQLISPTGTHELGPTQAGPGRGWAGPST